MLSGLVRGQPLCPDPHSGPQGPGDSSGIAQSGSGKQPLPSICGIRCLPVSLDAAVQAMEADRVVMEALGPYAVRYAARKRQEWEEYRTQISQWELDKYLTNC